MATATKGFTSFIGKLLTAGSDAVNGATGGDNIEETAKLLAFVVVNHYTGGLLGDIRRPSCTSTTEYRIPNTRNPSYTGQSQSGILFLHQLLSPTQYLLYVCQVGFKFKFTFSFTFGNACLKTTANSNPRKTLTIIWRHTSAT